MFSVRIARSGRRSTGPCKMMPDAQCSSITGLYATHGIESRRTTETTPWEEPALPYAAYPAFRVGVWCCRDRCVNSDVQWLSCALGSFERRKRRVRLDRQCDRPCRDCFFRHRVHFNSCLPLVPRSTTQKTLAPTSIDDRHSPVPDTDGPFGAPPVGGVVHPERLTTLPAKGDAARSGNR